MYSLYVHTELFSSLSSPHFQAVQVYLCTFYVYNLLCIVTGSKNPVQEYTVHRKRSKQPPTFFSFPFLPSLSIRLMILQNTPHTTLRTKPKTQTLLLSSLIPKLHALDHLLNITTPSKKKNQPPALIIL